MLAHIILNSGLSPSELLLVPNNFKITFECYLCVFFFLLLNRGCFVLFFSWSSFRFTAKFSRRYSIPIYLLSPFRPPPHHFINIPHQSGTFATIDEFTLAHHHPPKSIVYFRVHSLCLFCGF